MELSSFTYDARIPRVVFGRGTMNQLAGELQKLGAHRPLLLSTQTRRSLAETVREQLEEANIEIARIFDKAVMHTPVEVTSEALQFAEPPADAIVSLGGGSTVGLGKALHVQTELPHISLVTTYSGSEMTAILGETKDGRKTTWRAPKILPATVVYDVDLTLTLPAATSAVSGINAMAHAGSYVGKYSIQNKY